MGLSFLGIFYFHNQGIIKRLLKKRKDFKKSLLFKKNKR